jgi:hypothetical protein
MMYAIVEAQTADQLCAAMADWLDKGWQPLGNVCVTAVRDHNARDDYWDIYWNYAQAMTCASTDKG